MLRESERLKGQIEERDTELAVLMRKLKVSFLKGKNTSPIYPAKQIFILIFLSSISLQEQSVNDETDMQMMKTHTESLLDTLRDIAQVSCTANTLAVRGRGRTFMSVFICQSVLQEGDSSSEADQENSGTPLLALFHSSSTRRSTSPSRSSSQALLPDSALCALRSAVTNKSLQLQVTC